jgi:hypothetical protein
MYMLSLLLMIFENGIQVLLVLKVHLTLKGNPSLAHLVW